MNTIVCRANNDIIDIKYDSDHANHIFAKLNNGHTIVFDTNYKNIIKSQSSDTNNNDNILDVEDISLFGISLPLQKPMQQFRNVINKRINKNSKRDVTCEIAREFNMNHDYIDIINEKKDLIGDVVLNIGSINHPRGLVLSSIGCDIFVFETKDVIIQDNYSGVKLNSIINLPLCQPILPDGYNDIDKFNLLLETYSSNQYGFGGIKMGEMFNDSILYAILYAIYFS